MLRDLSTKGFASMVEVIITAVVFVLTTAGILTTLTVLRPHGGEAGRKIEAAYLGKGVINGLRREVDATTWNDAGSNLALGVHNWGIINGYTVQYTVTEPIPDLRHLAMNITW